MPLNPFFNNMRETSEQDLSHDIYEETIQMTGIEIYYIKTESINSPDFDKLFGQNRFEVLRDAYQLEAYPRNFEQPMMGDDLFTKFGVSMNQQITLELPYRRVELVLGGRPREGDYIYIVASTPREMNDVFKINYVDTDDEFYNPQGTILRYILKCERATFTHQELQTGIENFDHSKSEDSETMNGDTNADNELIQGLSDMFLDFDETHPFGKP